MQTQRRQYAYNQNMTRTYWLRSILIALVSLLVFWLPFALKATTFWGIDFQGSSMQTIVTNFDGINFLVVAKSLYDPHVIEIDYASILSGRHNLYFSAHYPGFPLLVGAFDSFLSGPNALLAAIVLSNALLASALYLFFAYIAPQQKTALFLTTLALFLPARMLSVRGVGSNEPLFIFFILTSLLASIKGKPWLAGLLGSASVLTRSPGILLFAAYMLPLIQDLWHKRRIVWASYVPYFLIPAALLGLWFYYGVVFGDFFAYFKVGGNINLHFPPFLVFGSHFDWVSGMWLEDIIYTYLAYGIGLVLFWQNLVRSRPALKVVGYFGFIYLSMLAFVVHRDLARYALPLAPLALAGYAPYLQHKYVRYGLIVLLVPIFLYAWNFVLHNTQPVMDWSAFL
jgi:Gpi18-like mannosyltransferase